LPIRIRKAEVKDAEGIAKVHIDTMRTTYQGIYPADFLSSLSYGKAGHTWETVYLSPKSHDAVYVAEDDSKKIVGFVIYGKDRDNDTVYKGEVIGVYMLRSMQRRGIGKQLMLAAVKDLKSRGFASMIVWVLADNPSRGFYERLGGEHVQTREITVGGKRFQEYGYGWKNLDSLADTAGRP
jgi:ribosomal protein S18 acetylase RimI-like enzyme